MTIDTIRNINVPVYGKKIKKASEYVESSGLAETLDYSKVIFPQPKSISWDDLSEEVVSELMIWETASSQDISYLENLSE